jgi:hypothetical protein
MKNQKFKEKKCSQIFTTMTKSEIQVQLNQNYTLFCAFYKTMNEEDFRYTPPEKWDTGQHLDHIRRAISPIVLATALPKWLLRILFGKANRASRNFDGLVIKYQEKLAAGGRASGQFIPKPIPFSVKEKQIESIEEIVVKINHQLERWSEADLDTYLLPHPILGKLTVREMMYFTVYHAVHHHHLAKTYLSTRLRN